MSKKMSLRVADYAFCDILISRARLFCKQSCAKWHLQYDLILKRIVSLADLRSLCTH